MPEGPEVKIASDYLNNHFESNKKINFEIITDYYRNKYLDVFTVIKNYLNVFTQSYTIGKNIFINLDKNKIFNFHLGMTGGWSKENKKHCHFRIYNDKQELFFVDIRKFGKMKILNKDEFLLKFNPKIDLLNKEYCRNYHLEILEKINTTRSICSIIMDQKFFPGVGNYIKSEALYLAKIHPEEKWKNINIKSKKILINSLKKIMKESYYSGGAELKDFKNPFKSSKFKLKVYGKKNTDNKTNVISIVTSDQRKSWYCEKTQKLKN